MRAALMISPPDARLVRKNDAGVSFIFIFSAALLASSRAAAVAMLRLHNHGVRIVQFPMCAIFTIYDLLSTIYSHIPTINYLQSTAYYLQSVSYTHLTLPTKRIV